MKNLKRLLALTVVSSLAFAMVGCGSDDKKEEGNKESQSGEAVFNIGAIGPTTGAAAVYGLAVKNGAQIAIDEINAAGGINGTQIEFNFQDDEHDSEKSVNAYNTLKDWNMDILLGAVTSNPCIAVASEAANDECFMLTPSGSSPKIIEGKTNVFQVCFSDPNQGTGSAQVIAEQKMASKVAVIYDSSDVYSSGIYEKFAAEAANQSIEIVAAEAFTADTKTDFTVQLQKAKEAGAELLFLPIYAQEASLVLSQAASMDFAPIFFGCDGLDGILAIKGFDAKLAEGVILLTPFVADSTEEATVEFVNKYQTEYNEVPNQFAADSYDGVYILKAAIEKAGVTADQSNAEISEALKAAMTEITIDGLTGVGMTWQATGEVSKAPKAMVIKDGVYTSLQ